MAQRLFVIFSLMAFVASTLAEEASLVRIDLQRRGQLEQLQLLGVEIVYYNRSEGFVEAIITDGEKAQLLNSRFTLVPIIEQVGAYVEQLRNQDYFEPFHTYDEMVAEMEQLVQDYPGFASLHDIGDSYNKRQGQGGYDIWALKISDQVKVEDSAEADVLIMANMHAREVITPEIVMFYMRYLLENYQTNPYAHHLVNNREIWLIPTANPDGHEYVFTGDIDAARRFQTSDPVWWRKNMRDNNENGSFEPGADGVDLNRNFSFMWGYNNAGSSPDMWEATYRGTGPFSEPETQAIRDLVLEHQFITSLSFHGYGELLLYPWGYDAIPLPEPQGAAFRAIADSSVAYNGYLAGNYLTGAIYQANGETDDWLFGEQGVYAFTPEVGSSANGRFWPDTTLIQPLILENLGTCLFISHVAGEEPIVEHKRLPDYDLPQSKYRLDVTIKKPILLTEEIPLEESSFTVFFKTDIDSLYHSLPLNRIGTLDRYTADIPGDSLATTYYYYVEAMDQAGRRMSSPKAAPVFVDSFKIASDTTPPVASHASPGFLHPDLSHTNLVVQATDNVGIKSVSLEYRVGPAERKTIELSPATEDSFFVPLDSLFLSPGQRVEYRFVITDASINANQTILPLDGWFESGLLKSVQFWDFEREQAFTANSGGDWEWGVPTTGPGRAFSGSKAWATKLSSDYSSSSNSTLDSPALVLTNLLKEPTLFFRHWYRTEMSSGSTWDGGNIKISVDDGEFKLFTPRNGYPVVIDPYNRTTGGEGGFGGVPESGPGWLPVYLDLKEFVGHTIKIRFHFGSDDNTDMDGWFIDDVELLGFPEIETAVTDNANRTINNFQLSQNYPNPFNSETVIRYSLDATGDVSLSIYNTLGQPVRTLLIGRQSGGEYQLKWDGTDNSGNPLPSGVYFYYLETKQLKIAKKLLLMR